MSFSFSLLRHSLYLGLNVSRHAGSAMKGLDRRKFLATTTSLLHAVTRTFLIEIQGKGDSGVVIVGIAKHEVVGLVTIGNEDSLFCGLVDDDLITNKVVVDLEVSVLSTQSPLAQPLTSRTRSIVSTSGIGS